MPVHVLQFIQTTPLTYKSKQTQTKQLYAKANKPSNNFRQKQVYKKANFPFTEKHKFMQKHTDILPVTDKINCT